jgi:hypothetical protein
MKWKIPKDFIFTISDTTACPDCLRWAARYRKRRASPVIEVGQALRDILTFGRSETNTKIGNGKRHGHEDPGALFTRERS